MPDNSKMERPSTNSNIKKNIDIRPVKVISRTKNGHIAHNPPPKPIKTPKK